METYKIEELYENHMYKGISWLIYDRALPFFGNYVILFDKI